MKLLVFAGSTRQQSLNRRLAHATADMARTAGATVTHLELADFDLPIYNADLEASGLPPDVMRLKQLCLDHDGWIICSPEYNGSYTALLKNTIDWISRPVPADPAWTDGLRPFRGKVVGLLSASPGPWGGLRGQAHLASLLLTLRCWVAPTSHALGQAAGAFDANGQLADAAARQAVQAVIDQVVTTATRLQRD